ncbi:hypothetical protein, partial [Streptobacillus moniliformis]|uniref:hypothetical protein n=1 Tax=Streptobacillus moniliformis TaxID=34105 RepID=UPI0018C8A77E
QASVAVALAIFLNDLTGGALNPTFFKLDVLGYVIPFGYLQVVAISAIAIATIINCATVAVSGGVAAFLTVIKITLVLGLGFGAFFLARNGDWSHFAMSNIGGACFE